MAGNKTPTGRERTTHRAHTHTTATVRAPLQGRMRATFATTLSGGTSYSPFFFRSISEIPAFYDAISRLRERRGGGHCRHPLRFTLGVRLSPPLSRKASPPGGETISLRVHSRKWIARDTERRGVVPVIEEVSSMSQRIRWRFLRRACERQVLVQMSELNAPVLELVQVIESGVTVPVRQ